MKTNGNRPGRKEHRRHGHAIGARPTRLLRWAVLLGALASLAVGPATASAQTGGAGVVRAGGGARAADLVFAPPRTAGATWYGPGLYGNHTACGQTLRPNTVGVAHRTLPCGTAIRFAYRGRRLVTRVIDRGPYTVGNAFDLTNGARRALGFEGVGRVSYAIAVKPVRKHR